MRRRHERALCAGIAVAGISAGIIGSMFKPWGDRIGQAACAGHPLLQAEPGGGRT